MFITLCNEFRIFCFAFGVQRLVFLNFERGDKKESRSLMNDSNIYQKLSKLKNAKRQTLNAKRVSFS